MSVQKRRPKGNGAARRIPTKPIPKAPEIKVIDEQSFKRLVKSIKNAEADKSEAVATIGGLVSSAVDKKYLHKMSFGIYRRLEKLSDQRLKEALIHLSHYLDIGGLHDRAARQQEMFARTEPGEIHGMAGDFTVKKQKSRDTIDNDFVPLEEETLEEFEPEAA